MNDAQPFYKAQLHCHSLNSDGKIGVEEQKRLFKERGYSVVAFTDHEHLVDNSYLDDDDFLTITSCEVAIKEDAHKSTLKDRNMKAIHLNFYALDQHNVITPCYNSTIIIQMMRSERLQNMSANTSAPFLQIALMR